MVIQGRQFSYARVLQRQCSGLDHLACSQSIESGSPRRRMSSGVGLSSMDRPFSTRATCSFRKPSASPPLTQEALPLNYWSFYRRLCAIESTRCVICWAQRNRSCRGLDDVTPPPRSVVAQVAPAAALSLMVERVPCLLPQLLWTPFPLSKIDALPATSSTAPSGTHASGAPTAARARAASAPSRAALGATGPPWPTTSASTAAAPPSASPPP